MDFTAERKCIHELANHLTIIQGAVRKVLKTIDEQKLNLSEEHDRLIKADDYLKKGIDCLKTLRSEIQEKMDHLPDQP